MVRFIKRQDYINHVAGTDDYHEAYKHITREKEAAMVTFDNKSPQIIVRPILVKLIKNAMDRLNLNCTTMNLAINVLDFVMDAHDIPDADRLLLLTATSLNIAIKLDEPLDNQPSIFIIFDLMKIEFTLDQYKKCEQELLTFFNFNFNFPTATSYVGYYMAAMVCPTDVEVTGQSFVTLFYEQKFYIEKYLDKVFDNHHFLYCFKPSQLAAALIFVARVSSNILLEPWTEKLTQFTDYTLEQISPLGQMIYGKTCECARCGQNFTTSDIE